MLRRSRGSDPDRFLPHTCGRPQTSKWSARSDMLLSLDRPLLLADRPDHECASVSTVLIRTGWARLERRESRPSVRLEHVESSGVGEAAEVGAQLSVRALRLPG
jgi:hypothetical protein